MSASNRHAGLRTNTNLGSPMNHNIDTLSGPETASFSRLEHFPVTFFAVIMGLMGLTLAFQSSSPFLPVADVASHVFLAVSILVFACIAGIYALKFLRYPDALKDEWNHPVKLAFFPTMSIALLLTATALYTDFPGIARIVWLMGVAAQGILTLSVLTGWISNRSFEQGHLTPAWFIPAVGNVIVPVAGAHMGYTEVSWLFFSGGMIFWIVLLTLVFNRMVFHDPIPGRLFPTMVILIAPPAVAFVAYYNLVGQIDPFARILLNSAYVFALLIVMQLPKLVRLPFALSWWALSFPVAALTIASFRYAHIMQSMAHQVIGFMSLLTLCVIIAGLVYRTLVAITRDEVCRPE